MLKQAAARYLAKPGLISLGGVLPHPACFPFESLSMTVPLPDGFSQPSSSPSSSSSSNATSPSPHTTEAGISKYDMAGDAAEYDLATALNYGQASGSAQLLRWVTEHTELVCAPPYADWRCAPTVGSTGALEQALRIFGPDGASGLLTEEFSFSTALETAAPLGMPVFGVPMDREGMLPAALNDLLSTWDPTEHRGLPPPRLLYTVPSGQNPTGATQDATRRQHLYDVCRKHDVYIR